ncbi:unnamed protein product [Haemonchus placei]|uniref:Uncharacterized protein n=1 Tax=Haemonchus placei TaxID=6290 RepID=A0A3P8B7E8_HAEPC|nr:unnamed protein product [Haemonchus placei]
MLFLTLGYSRLAVDCRVDVCFVVYSDLECVFKPSIFVVGGRRGGDRSVGPRERSRVGFSANRRLHHRLTILCCYT